MLVALVLLLCAGRAAADDPGDVLWQRAALRTREIAAALDGVMAVGVLDLRGGRSFLHRGQQLFPSASIIKVPILIELYRQAQGGLLDLRAPVVVRREAQLGDEGLLSQLGDGTTTMALADLAAAMIVLSENSATNLLIDRLGMDRVNQTLRLSGLGQTHLRRRMLDMEAARSGRENVTTVADMLRLLQLLWDKGGSGLGLGSATQGECLRLLGVLDKPGALMGLGVPKGVVVRSKPGALDGLRSECGIIEEPGRPFVICVMTTLLRDDADGAALIPQVTRLWYDALHRIGRTTKEGRLFPPAPSP